MAYHSSSQTVSNNSEETIEFDQSDSFSGQGNANTWYSTSTYKYTPQVAGVYYLHVNCFWDSTTSTDKIQHRARIRKNGSDYIADAYSGVNEQYGAFAHSASCIAYMNGSSDYIQFRAFSHADDGTNGVLEDGKHYSYGFGYLLEAT